jgi:protein tyrosine phosphatase
MSSKASSNRSDPIAPDTVRFVEKIIAVVRKRRSMKAIETYEQVSFLVDFVHYLREGRTSTISSNYA